MLAIRIATLLSLVAALGCRTAPIPAPYVIPVPKGLTSQQTEVAVLAGILNTSPPADYDPTKPLSDQEFNTLLWQKFVGSARAGRSWFPESREGRTIFAAVNTRGLYLRAAIETDVDQVRISIVESRNLSQGDGRIRKRAIQWIDNLEAHIRRELGRMSVISRTAS